LIRVQIPDGEFIGDAKGLQEFIDNLRQTDAALADMVQQAADTNGGAQKAVESANKVQEETSKTLKTVGDSHRALESTLRSTQTASQTTTQVAQQTQQVVDMAIGQMAVMTARINQQQADLSSIAMQLRSMRS
jgi:methyl-accepting chemotaxis protein